MELDCRSMVAFHLKWSRFWRKRIEPSLLDKLADADDRFRQLLLPGMQLGNSKTPWWRRSVPMYGTDLFAESIQEMYDVTLQDPNETID